MACRHVSASTHVYTCHELSHAHDVHAKHAQVLGAKGLCPESLSEDSTDEPAVGWAGLCGELKGPMALLISYIKAF